MFFLVMKLSAGAVNVTFAFGASVAAEGVDVATASVTLLCSKLTYLNHLEQKKRKIQHYYYNYISLPSPQPKNKLGA